MANRISALIRYLSQDMPLQDNFSDYNEYWESRGFHAPSLNRAKIISKHVERGKKILDVGCGDGTIIEYLDRMNNPKRIIGLDISNYAVGYVLKKGYDARVMDILDIRFEKFLKSNQFDYIIITEVLEHIHEPEKVIENIKKYCPDATIFISIPNSGFIAHRIRLLMGKFPVIIIVHHVKEHIRFWTHADFKYWIKFQGYDLRGAYVCSTIKILGIDLGRFFPSIFAQQIIYEIKKNDGK